MSSAVAHVEIYIFYVIIFEKVVMRVSSLATVVNLVIFFNNHSKTGRNMTETVATCTSVVLSRCQNFITGKSELNVMQIDTFIS